MLINDIMRLFLSGNRDLLPEEIRIQIIQQVLNGRKAAVNFELGATCCPVCRVFGIIQREIKVKSTQSNGAVRYCECLRCGANFVAVGESRSETVEVTEEIQVKRSAKKNNKKRRR